MAQQLPLMDPGFDGSDLRPEDAERSGTQHPGPTRRPGGRGSGVAPGSPPARATVRSRKTALAAIPDRPDDLVEIPVVDWRIDQHTKEVGLAGVAAARRALAAAVGRAAA